MKTLCLLAGPALAAAHGIALPVTDQHHEVVQAGQAAIKVITEAVQECGREILECAPKLIHGWEAAAQCLIDNVEAVADESCKDHVENIARHLPLALFAAGRVAVEPSQGLQASDIGKRVNKGCDLDNDVLPYVWSYHLHVQWDFGCHTCKETALNFTERFIQEFQPDAKMCRRMAFLTDLWNTDSIPRERHEDHHFADICKMATLPPGGPFLHSEKGFTLSTTMFHRALPWLMANRPANDKVYMIVHPNTGCQYNDLRHWSLWVSPNVRMFYDILKGCVWASCEDQVLGCIGFNHMRPSSGYGQCFTPPTEIDVDCKMVLGDSNVTTEKCSKSSTSLI